MKKKLKNSIVLEAITYELSNIEVSSKIQQQAEDISKITQIQYMPLTIVFFLYAV